MKWQQRARVKWLRHGDQNTRYFHAMATSKLRNKFVPSLLVQNQLVYEPQQILSAFHDYYRNLLGSIPSTQDYNPSAIYSDDSISLFSLGLPFSEHEVKKAVMGLADNKASGPDGLPNEFFKIHWELVKADLLSVFELLYRQQLDLSSANLAHLVLLPKKDNAQEVIDFRPISIVSYLPKLISKVLSNRLSHFMPALISSSQTGFIKGRIISENFNTAREMIFNISRSTEPSFMFKIDFHKAFDSVSWSFLLKTMRCRGFPLNFLSWIELLFGSSYSSLLVNGLVGPPFLHQRGLRQGDPISPSLFLLASDVLSRMMQAAAITLREHLSSKLTDPFYILQYADDTLFFSTAKGQAPRTLLLVLESFSKVSGMKLNLMKSSFVPFNLSQQSVLDLQELLGCSSTTLPIQYLGLPLTDRRPDRSTFQILIDKLTKRLSGWKAKLLSRAGRVVLASSVLSTIPIFFMSVFKLPMWVIRAIDRIRREFIWKGVMVPNRGVHLLSWDRVCLPKSLGGFGLLNLNLHNLSLLLRWWWRIYDKPSSQWGTITKLLYGSSSRCSPPLTWKQSGSFFWKDLRRMRSLFQISVSAEVHNGQGTLFWFDNWSGTFLRSFDSDCTVSNRYITVREALPILGQLLPSPLNYNESYLISAAHTLQLSRDSDKLLWKWRRDGHFSTSSVYKQLISAGKSHFAFKNIWKIRVPSSVHLFLVLLAHDRILTQEQLLKRNIPFQPKCVLCGLQILENREHLFGECEFARNLWSGLHIRQASVLSLLQLLCTPNSACRITLATAFWGLWLERNSRIFRNEHRPLDVILQWIIQQATLFTKFC
ncbi:hypothetical protein LUZ63_016546 [Rhynchospora breviuscula]|uniref:Reverse transcriptase domain-containing protein n=1 Tax=Rhynchospora breviuscula TaxID=2022672 RepID=A0A9P9ZA46_9POAL|nr:hypothetical protein LUZ63_016546 [Rhynchospora breviuscula]